MHKVFKLSNGIPVVTESTDYVKSVSAGVWIYAGSAMENSKNNGVAHFIDHMLFKGTTTRSAREIAEYMDAVGGHLNAVTAHEYTCYYTRTLAEHLDMAFEILSDMIRNSTFTDENIEIERKVITEEINMSEDDPEDLIHDILCRTMWKDEPLGFPIAGTVKTVKGMDKGCILDYYKGRYIADNIVISVVGNLDEKSAIDMLEEKFGGIERQNIIRKPQKKLIHTRNAEIVKKDIEQCQLCLGFEGYSRQAEKSYDLAVVNALFGGNMSSRLFQKVREESGLAYSVYSYTDSYQENGSLAIYAGLNPEELKRALDIIVKEIKILKRDKLTKDEVETAKTQMKAAAVMGNEGLSARMSHYGKSMLFENTAKNIDDVIRHIDAVSAEGVAEVIDSVFDGSKMALALLGNIKDTEDDLMSILDF